MLNAQRQAPVPITAAITAQTPDAELAVRGAQGDEAAFEAIMRRMVDGGKLAQMNIDQHRDESTARRAVRKVFR